MRSGGIDLLSEAGPYGYDYKDPLTRAGYSSYAHNCLVVDGVSLPRTDNSAALTTLTAQEVRADGFRVTGRTARLKDTTHSRTVEIYERDDVPYLDVLDTIESPDRHAYELLWNLGTDVDVVLHGQGFELFHDRPGKSWTSSSRPASPPGSHCTREKPGGPLGWRFPRFGEAVPAPVVKISFLGAGAEIRTQFDLPISTTLTGDSLWKRTVGGGAAER